jgi:hypothetical protein
MEQQQQQLVELSLVSRDGLPGGLDNGTWSTPHAFDCRDRITGLYSCYILVAMSAMGITVAMLLDPSCGITPNAVAWRTKLNARREESEINPKSGWEKWTDGERSFYRINHDNDDFLCSLDDVPSEGVKYVIARVGGNFDFWYAEAQLEPSSAKQSTDAEQCETNTASAVNPLSSQ